MPENFFHSLTALLSLLPAALFPWRHAAWRHAQVRGRPPAFWAALALAVAGPAWCAAQLVGQHWQTGLATALWVTIAACTVLFAGLCLTVRVAWRLSPILFPYLLAAGVLATLAQGIPGALLRGGAPGIWIDIHIAVSVITYALLTLAAVASSAAFIQERALKAKRPTPLTRVLPPMAESERLQVRLLAASQAVLGAGLLTGMAVLYYQQGVVLRFDHKTLFSLATFAVIGGLLLAHARTGVRGRTVARLVLVAYLLLTLAYPGVKFVTDVLLA
jgi:ABC-type uncharacterized transport system permease subunit